MCGEYVVSKPCILQKGLYLHQYPLLVKYGFACRSVLNSIDKGKRMLTFTTNYYINLQISSLAKTLQLETGMTLFVSIVS